MYESNNNVCICLVDDFDDHYGLVDNDIRIYVCEHVYMCIVEKIPSLQVPIHDKYMCVCIICVYTYMCIYTLTTGTVCTISNYDA
jgi:hypothetical protein